MLSIQRGITSVIVASSTEQVKDLLFHWPGSSPWASGFDLGSLLQKNPGGRGRGSAIELIVSIWWMVDIVGRSTGFSWTHNSPIWIYLMTSSLLQLSLMPGSTSSCNDLLSQSLQTCWSYVNTYIHNYDHRLKESNKIWNIISLWFLTYVTKLLTKPSIW